jgi:hypothetical protein
VRGGRASGFCTKDCKDHVAPPKGKEKEKGKEEHPMWEEADLSNIFENNRKWVRRACTSQAISYLT